MKNYRVGGVSETIHEGNKNLILNVSGPMGRSLDVDATGLNVAFAAGTGVLPFMDLVGYISRQTLNLEAQIDRQKLDPNFFLWFVVRTNSSEAIGHDLLQALEKANSR